MKLKREIVEIFGRCSRWLSKIALNAEDGFFSQLCIKESDKLLSEFIFFLKGEENVRHVAQCCQPLISQIKNILNLLDILKHLGLAKPPTSLLLERDLLLLELSVLDISQPMVWLPEEAKEPVIPKVKKTNLHPLPNPSPKLGKVHREILEFIKNKEQTQNLEVFNQFAHISRRTLKKKLSELVGANVIKRIADGKKVFYAAFQEERP